MRGGTRADRAFPFENIKYGALEADLITLIIYRHTERATSRAGGSGEGDTVIRAGEEGGAGVQQPSSSATMVDQWLSRTTELPVEALEEYTGREVLAGAELHNSGQQLTRECWMGVPAELFARQGATTMGFLSDAEYTSQVAALLLQSSHLA